MKKLSKLRTVCFFILALIVAGCSTESYKTKTNVSEADTKSQYHDYGRSAVLNFSKGSSGLTDSEKEKLKSVAATIGADNIKRVEIASWSDKNFPETGPDLPKVDRELADERATNIYNFLKEPIGVSFLRIRTYSMAETSNWLARMFRTDGAELKSVFAKDAEAPMVRDDFNVILNEGGPSKAVVIFIRK